MSAKPLWTVAEAAQALALRGNFPETAIDFVTQDSRLVKPGSLFVALSGTPSGGFVSSFASARDGWEFAASAEAAAQTWYGIPAARLDRDQSARLAAVIPSPLKRRPARMNTYAAEIERRMTQMGW